MTSQRWTADQIPDQRGRIFIVTGANSGLGLATTRELTRHGGHVVLAVRDAAKGERAIAELRADQPDASLEQRHLDLADLDSVRAFAAALRADGVRPDVLVNNAGIMMPPRSLSPQGQESQFAANHLGHFALTGLLLDLIRRSPDGRVVTVSSGVHRRGRIHFDDLTGERSYSPTGFYAQSKFANVLFGLELDRRLRAAGLPVRSILAHPGYAATNLVRPGPRLLRLAVSIGNRILAQSAADGALPQLYAATAPGAEGGQFIGPAGLGEQRGHPVVVRPSAAATDPRTAERLWTLSEELTGVHYGLTAAA
ncbi:oxidoreductase [Solwaraspora sp. WMMD1047]|uniref:oxidoreductase n=1 Tax=Solwaraspora sp. WMMD1047 TaxID=3016102 RepID=UPI002416DF83|nr:oxidoreductase [Solwaraspora sp. WMMD1047]MDG4833639.1 oxidoreductase [Solwaraspora sp. WMMD1047]